MRRPWTGLRRFLGFTTPSRTIARGRTRTRLLLERLEDRTLLSGVWTQLTNSDPSGSTVQLLLMPNGSVMVQAGFNQNGPQAGWEELTPSNGNYANGTFSSLASMATARAYYASDVLSSGKVFVVGGEYSSAGNETNLGEMYNIAGNSWSAITTNPYASRLGDCPSDVLPDGTVLVGDPFSSNTYVYNPGTNGWSTTGSRLYGDTSGEEGFVKLPDNSLLTVDLQGSVNEEAQRYIPSSGTWVDAGNVGVQLGYPPGPGYVDEMGPGFLLPNGQAFFLGASGATAYYTESSNTWTVGPSIPNGLGCADAAGAMMPNGNILFAAGPLPSNGNWPNGTSIYEYNPTTQVYTNVTPSDPNLPYIPVYATRMLDLPSGQVLFSDFSGQLWVYTPSGSPTAGSQPNITSITNNGSGSFSLSGTQLNGISEGASYGDDAQQATNYPIVQLTDQYGNIFYATTSNWSSTGVATGSTPESTSFQMPSSTTNAYLLSVIANGIASNNVLNVQANNGDAITIQLDPNNSNYTQVLNNNSLLAEFYNGSFSSIMVSGSGSNTVTVLSTPSGVTTEIVGGGSDTVNVGNGSTQAIGGDIDIENPPSYTTINVNDSTDSTSHTVTLNNIGANPIDSQNSSDPWGQIGGLLGNGNLNYEYYDTNNVTIDTGTGSNTIDVNATGGIGSTNIVTDADATINVGNGTVSGITSTLNIESPPAYNTININDSADSTVRTVTLNNIGTNSADSQGNSDPWGQVSGLGSAPINYEYADTNGFTLNTGSASGNVINVQATGSVGVTNIVTNANATINVGNNDNVSGIQGVLNIESPPAFNTININDAADFNPYTVTMGTLGTNPNDSQGNTDSWGYVSGLGAAANINYEYDDTQSITLETGSNNDVIDVLATGATPYFTSGVVTHIVTNLDSTINVGNGGSVADIQGELDIEAQEAFNVNTINVDDSADTGTHTVTMSTLGANPIDIENNSDSWGQISGLAPAVINYEYGDTSSLTVDTGTAAGNVINVLTAQVQVVSGGTTNISTNAATTINVGNAGNAQGITGILNLSGPANSITLTVDDSADTASLTTTVTTTSVSGLTPAAINFTAGSLASLTLDGGSGVDTWYVDSTLAGSPLTVNTGNAANSVFLALASEQLGSIQGAVTVNGGTGSNILVGEDQNDSSNDTYTLSAGSIQRTGAATIDYSGNFRVYINGSTTAAITYDINSTAVPLYVTAGNGNNTFVITPASDLVTNIQSIVTLTAGTGTNTLTVDDQNDTPSLTFTLNTGSIQRTNTGLISYSGISSVTVNGSSTASFTYNINSTASGTSTTINAGTGANIFNLASPSDLLSSIAGNVTLNGGGSNNYLNVYDQNDTTNGDTYTITASTVQRSGTGLITYTGVGSVTVNGSGTAAITYNINGTAAGTQLNLNGGSGANVFNLAPSSDNLNNLAGLVSVITGSASTVNVDDQSNASASTYTITANTVGRSGFGGLAYSGSNTLVLNGGSAVDVYDINSTAAGSSVTVNAGNGNTTFVITPSSDLLSNIQGAVALNGGTGSNTLTVNDQNDGNNDTYTLAVGSIARTGAASLSYSGVGNVTVNGSSTAAVTYNINGTAAATSLTVNAGNGNNAFVLTPSSDALGNIQGAVTLNTGTGSSTLTVDDQNDASNDTYTFAVGSIARTGAASISYSGIHGIFINGSSTAAITFNINSTDSLAPLTVTCGSGANVFNLAPASENLNNLSSAVTIQAGSASTVNLDDQLNATVHTYTVSANNVSRTGFGGLIYAGLGALRLNGGSAADTYDIFATASGSTLTVTGGAANDIFNVGDASNTLNGILGAVSVTGGGGTNTLNVKDQGSATGQSYTLSSTVLTRSGAASITYAKLAKLTITASGNDSMTVLNAPTVATTFNGGTGTNTLTGPNLVNSWTIKSLNGGALGKLTYSNVQNLVGGTNVDTFTFGGTAGKETTISGGGAPSRQGDWLNYAAFASTTTVTVDLATGAATNVSGSVSGIQNVIGGKGTNTLTGDAQGNILIGGSGSNTIVGGSGNSLLIGGSGHGSITAGSSGEDILIAGTTTYSLSTAAGKNSLMAILAELQSADTFAEQVYDLIHGTDSGDPNGHGSDLNGANKLTWGGTSPKVKPSTGSFTLNRDAAAIADWFFSNTSSTVNGFVNGVDEHNNNAIGVF